MFKAVPTRSRRAGPVCVRDYPLGPRTLQSPCTRRSSRRALRQPSRRPHARRVRWDRRPGRLTANEGYMFPAADQPRHWPEEWPRPPEHPVGGSSPSRRALTCTNNSLPSHRQSVDINVTPIGPGYGGREASRSSPANAGERRAPGPRADHRSTVRVVADRSADRARRARDPGQAGSLVTRDQCRSTTRALPHATEMAQPADKD